MRVITGSCRGAKLRTLDGLETRPTADRVKEAVFNVLQFDIQGRRVLDLFAGSGQLAIEALSRGAASAVLVDRSQGAVEVIRWNLEHLRLTDRATVLRQDYLRYLELCRERFDMIFLDPPYQSDCLETALRRISEIDILSDGGIIVCEKPREKVLHPDLGPLHCTGEYRYGKTAVNLYTRRKP